jgi:hypothetical protein
MAKSRRIYMKAAIITAPGVTPIYGEFEKPSAKEGEEIISVRAAALTNLTKSRASGAHYSSSGIFPAVVGTDGVGVTQDGRRVYFAMPEAPNGAMAEFPTPLTTLRPRLLRIRACLPGLASWNEPIWYPERPCL